MLWERSNTTACYIVTSLLLFQNAQPAHAGFFDPAQEAAASDDSYIDIALTPIYQYATRAGEDTGFDLRLDAARPWLLVVWC
jgi:hypothetical protein